MKRDLDLVREILIVVEKASEPIEPPLGMEEEYNEELINYHVKLLEQAGLIEAICNEYRSGRIEVMSIRSLTWEGHEFLDAARNESAWNEAKSTAKDKGVNLTFDLMQKMLTSILESMMLP